MTNNGYKDRVKIVPIHYSLLKAMFKGKILKFKGFEKVNIRNIVYNHETMCFDIIIESDDFKGVAPGCLLEKITYTIEESKYRITIKLLEI